MSNESGRDRRKFLTGLAAAGTVSMLGGCAAPEGQLTVEPQPIPSGTWPLARYDPAASSYSPEVRLDGSLGTPRRLFESQGIERTEAVVTPDTVWIHTVNGLVALDREGGGPAWTVEFSGLKRTSPAISDEFVYSVSAKGMCTAVDRESQTTAWQTELTTYAFRARPLLVGSVLFVPGTRNLGAIDVTTGKLHWERTVEETDIVHRGIAFANGLLVATASGRKRGKVYAIDPETRELRWARTDVGIPTTPPACSDTHVVFGTRDGRLQSFDLESGETDWTYDLGHSVVVPPSITDDGICLPSQSGQQTVFLDPEDGTPQWTLETDRVFTTPLSYPGGHLLGTGDGRLLLVDESGTVQDELGFTKPLAALAGVEDGIVVVTTDPISGRVHELPIPA